ncbi:T9SS type A sorting domain-containing protein [Flavilitoribacter nigricans]|uniref:Secretion system C-terminal sorting domain-containing protein n=1 Tax=Flavilitoribacter nigricans (strain ATCC 23147 / DSM 23189 / NBRC 102662 / NCIMB 1420 / SS-2) TaxID=1122177 RepID=A0A2D0N0T1_FLAN2|nr:T9SS type A sorting domain-containing protein [Flavilitoribacter nigricans]PHN01323.1 hypothetical protein CRP01_37830 [Flavilitoribacter nigricans DSM 23189 = NBRC 102662]
MKTCFPCLFFILLILSSCVEAPHEASGAGQAMEYWSIQRTYPDGRIHSRKLQQAYREWQPQLSLRSGEPWRALGPKNVGGRTLSLAFHPNDPELLFVGSASGGLWVSHSGGKGTQAWERVRTGFPVLGVSTIAINPDRPEEIFIGTGEVYNHQAARPAIDDRFHRGSYGMGILRSRDGGQSWQVSLDWRNTDLRGVWKIIYNPLRSATVLAATTEGIFRSRDGGNTWRQISDRIMATDLEMHPLDTNVIYASHGGYRSPETGIYRSTDGGNSFELLNSLPTQYSGKAMISLAPSEPDWLYVSIADNESSIGLFRSIDRGDNWALMNTEDVAKWQGWYAHDVAIHPRDPQRLVYVGIDTWTSGNGGKALDQRTYWQLWTFGRTAVGAPEGPDNYVHADIHGAYYHPDNDQRVFLVTDGGIFESINGGITWTSRNGGYQTQQFYADLASAPRDSNLAIGGLQDNSTVVYNGTAAWARRIGGDGMTAAIDPQDDQFIYGSLQNLNVLRSTDRGETFRRLVIGNSAAETRNFNSPFKLAPSRPTQLYAGAQRLYVSNNRGGTWEQASSQKDGRNAILKIAVSASDPDLLYFSTNSLDGSQAPAVFKSTSGGRSSWQRMEGLPDRICTDLEFHPNSQDTIFAVFGGYNSSHVFRTTNGGRNWTAIDRNLPDLPTNTIFIDPLHPGHLYIGNDLGVFASQDNGQRWEWISQDIAEAVMVMDLSYSPSNRKLRVATHGLGAYELALDELKLGGEPAGELSLEAPYPNPATDWLSVDFQVENASTYAFELVDVNGRILERHRKAYLGGEQEKLRYNLRDRAAGVYWLVIRDDTGDFRRTFRIVKL